MTCLSGHMLGEWISRRLAHYCSKYRSTTFVINSILHTRHRWLNCEADSFNRIIRQLAGTIQNLEFVDSHSAIMGDRISGQINLVLDRSDPRGTHLTFAAKRLVAGVLVQACEQLAGRLYGKYRGDTGRDWIGPFRSFPARARYCG